MRTICIQKTMPLYEPSGLQYGCDVTTTVTSLSHSEVAKHRLS